MAKNNSQSVSYFYQNAAMALGLMPANGMQGLVGKVNDYDLVLYPADSRYPYNLTMVVGVPSDYLNKDFMASLKKAGKMCARVLSTKGHLVVTFKSAKNAAKQQQLVQDIQVLIGMLQTKGIPAVCGLCHNMTPTREYLVGVNSVQILCPACAGAMKRQLDANGRIEETSKEYVLLGIVGAFLGSLAGALCIILFSELGYVSAISGIVMALCTMKLYEKFAGKITVKGIIICVAISLLMVYIGDRMDWAIVLYTKADGKEAGYSLFECFKIVPDCMKQGIIDASVFAGNLVLLYLFTIGGMVPSIISFFKKQKLKNRMIYIGRDTNS